MIPFGYQMLPLNVIKNPRRIQTILPTGKIDRNEPNFSTFKCTYQIRKKISDVRCF